MRVSNKAGSQYPWDGGHQVCPSCTLLAAPCRVALCAGHCIAVFIILATVYCSLPHTHGEAPVRHLGSPTFLAASPGVPGAAPPLSGGHCLVHHLVCGSQHGSVAERVPRWPGSDKVLCCFSHHLWGQTQSPQGSSATSKSLWSLSPPSAFLLLFDLPPMESWIPMEEEAPTRSASLSLAVNDH